jgi:hypothetical protein
MATEAGDCGPPVCMGVHGGPLLPPSPEPSTNCSSGTRRCAASPSRPRSAVATAMPPEGGWKCRRVTTFSPLTSAQAAARQAVR